MRSLSSAWVIVGAVVALAQVAHPQTDDPGRHVTTLETAMQLHVPADPDVAVGMDHVAVISNKEIVALPKQNFVQATPVLQQLITGTNGFWNPVDADEPFDPEILWDPYANRFWAMAIDIDERFQPRKAFIFVAVSATANPGGPWHKKRFDAQVWSGGALDPNFPNIDAPNMTVDGAWLYVNGWSNVFCTAPCNPVKSPTWILRKSSIMEGGEPGPNDFRFLPFPDPYNRKAVPALAQEFDVTDPAPQYLVGMDPAYPTHQTEAGNPGEFTAITLHAIVFGANDTPDLKSRGIAVPVAYRAPRDNAVQPPSGNALRLTSARFWGTPVYRNGHLWAVHHVRPVGSEVNVIRYYKIDMNDWYAPSEGGPPVVVLAGEITGSVSGRHCLYPSIAVNVFGDAVITYNEVGPDPSGFVSVRRLGISSLGVVYAASVKSEGVGLYEPQVLSAPFRWGDYSGSESDPADPCATWSHHSWAATGFPNEYRTWLTRSTPPELCYFDFGPDYFYDGALDALDLAEFENLYQSQSPRADFNRDGRLDWADYVDFVRALGAR